ncbi:hypothetical protein EM846_22185 [Escherichia coli]|nr:hypothetical protein [Escherichia coli]
MKIFQEPCPVSLQVNYMKNKKRGLLRTGHAQKIDTKTGHDRFCCDCEVRVFCEVRSGYAD